MAAVTLNANHQYNLSPWPQKNLTGNNIYFYKSKDFCNRTYTYHYFVGLINVTVSCS